MSKENAASEVHYYVSYTFSTDNKTGNAGIFIKFKYNIEYSSDIKCLTELIKKETGFDNVVIINPLKLKGRNRDNDE